MMKLRRQAFTLLELLIALVILAMCFTVIWRTFAATMNGWTRGNQFLEQLHHGDFVIEQVVSALRSSAYYASKPSAYGFWLDSRGGSLPRDKVSWVTSSTAFVGPRSPLANQLHRIQVTVESSASGKEGFHVTAWPPLADPDEYKPEEWTTTTKVKGFECEVYNWDTESWEGRWEDTNKIPSLVRVTVYLEPLEKFGEPIKLSRLVEIPIAGVTNAAPINESGGGPGGGAGGAQGAAPAGGGSKAAAENPS